jgi:hypothetical protein
MFGTRPSVFVALALLATVNARAAGPFPAATYLQFG